MFYRHFQTPHLSLCRDKDFTNIFLADGRMLLRENLPADAPVIDCYNAALNEIAFLVLRDLVDIIPLLQPCGDEHEWFALQQKDFYPIRYSAFLRGRIPFITLADLKKVTKKLWPHTQRNIQNSNPERFPGKGKYAKVISCDWVCLVCPKPIHDDVYACGRIGSTSTFDQEYVFKEAEKRDIIIDSVIRHHLETDVMKKVDGDRAKKRAYQKKSNGLPIPPEIPAKDEADQRYGRLDVVAVKEQKRIRDQLTFNRVKNRILQQSTIPCYKIDNVAVDRHQYMAYVVWAVSEGKRISEVCLGIKGMPSLLEVYKWRQMYPDFAIDLQAAEEIQGQVFADRALEIAEKVEEKEDIPVAKFKHRVLMERASLQAEKFRPKQVIQTEELENKNVSDLKRQLKVLLQGNIAALDGVIDVETLEQAEGQPSDEE